MKTYWVIVGICLSGLLQAQTPEFLRVEEQPGDQRYLDIYIEDSTLMLLGTNDKGIEIIEATRTGEIISSMRTTSTNDTTLNPFKLIRTSTGEYYVAAEKKTLNSSSSLLYKVDANFGLEPFTILKKDGSSQIISSCMEYRNCFYCSGIFSSPNMTFGNDMWVSKIDRNGKVLWSKNYGATDRNEVTCGLLVHEDRIYVFGDKNLPSFIYNPYHIILDTNGIFIEDTKLDWPYNAGVKSSCITSDAMYVTGESATATSPWFDLYVEKWDLDGHRLWRKMVPLGDESEAGLDIEYKNGLLWLTGYAHNDSTGDTDMHITILDSSGVFQERKLYHLGSVDIGYRVVLDDGGIYAVGSGTDPSGSGIDYIIAYHKNDLALTPVSERKSANMMNAVAEAGQVRIDIDQAYLHGKMEIFTADGKKVTSLTGNTKRQRVPLREKGIYIIRYTHGSTTQTEKISLY